MSVILPPSSITIYRELQDVNTQVQHVVNRSRVRKITTGSDDAILVNRLIKRIDWAVANMMVRSAHSRGFLECLHVPTRLVYLSTRQIRFKWVLQCYFLLHELTPLCSDWRRMVPMFISCVDLPFLIAAL
jgi:hypothetical protein